MGLNKSAKTQIEEGKSNRGQAAQALNSFQYGGQKQGLSNPFANTTNPFANITNPFANQRVATEAADYQRQTQDQSRADILDRIVQSGGNAAASATALAQQAAQSGQKIGAGLAKQQTTINAQAAQGEQRKQQLVATGEQRRQQLIGQGNQYLQGLSEARDSAKLSGLGAQYAGAQQTINAGYQSIGNTNAAVVGAIGDVVSAGVGLINPLG